MTATCRRSWKLYHIGWVVLQHCLDVSQGLRGVVYALSIATCRCWSFLEWCVACKSPSPPLAQLTTIQTYWVTSSLSSAGAYLGNRPQRHTRTGLQSSRPSERLPYLYFSLVAPSELASTRITFLLSHWARRSTLCPRGRCKTCWHTSRRPPLCLKSDTTMCNL